MTTSYASSSSINAKDEDEFESTDGDILVHDPFRKINESILRQNMKIYSNILIPTVTYYEENVPLKVRWVIKDFIANYTITTYDFMLSFLDYDVEGISVSLWRFMLNSTIGLGGLLDVATKVKIPSYNKTFDTVMDFHGIPEGPYIMMPLLGPRTTRGAAAFILNRLLNPYYMVSLLELDYLPFMIPAYATTTSPFYFIPEINDRIDIANQFNSADIAMQAIAVKGVVQQLDQSSLDPYSNYMNMYYQNLYAVLKTAKERRKNGVMKLNNVCDSNIAMLDDDAEDKCRNYDSYNIHIGSDKIKLKYEHNKADSF